MAEAADAAAAVASLAAAAVGAPSFKDAIATLQAHAATHPALGARACRPRSGSASALPPRF
jgi:hypothetical protein